MKTTKKDIIATAAAITLLPVGIAFATPKPGNPDVKGPGEGPAADVEDINAPEIIEDTVEATAGAVENVVEGTATRLGLVDEDYSEEKLPEVIEDIDSLETLSNLIDEAELEERLEGPGPFTIFAPTDSAFDKVSDEQLEMLMDDSNQAQLRKLLLGHVVEGRTLAKDFSAKTLNTAGGSSVKINIDGSTLMVGDSNITTADVVTANGVIHLIDTVIMSK